MWVEQKEHSREGMRDGEDQTLRGSLVVIGKQLRKASYWSYLPEEPDEPPPPVEAS